MKLIIAGSRDLEDKHIHIVYSAYKTFIDQYFTPTTILSGKARGADYIGEIIAIAEELAIEEFPADWEKHGKGAGPIRNVQMVDAADGLVLVRFKDSKGSINTLIHARQKNIPIIDIVLERETNESI